jgi:excisionase family DNA binding protein
MSSKRGTAEKPYLTPTEVAKLLRVSPVTVRHWALKGWLKAETTAGGHRRFLRHEIERFARERGMSLQLEDDGTIRILIVDDDESFSSFLVEALGTASETVETDVARDGFDAGRKVHTFKPHIVLLDLVMPGLDGFEVCRRLKNDPTTRAVRIVALTGYGTPEQTKRIMQEGAEVCLTKPISLSTLFGAVGIHSAVTQSALADG